MTTTTTCTFKLDTFDGAIPTAEWLADELERIAAQLREGYVEGESPAPEGRGRWAMNRPSDHGEAGDAAHDSPFDPLILNCRFHPEAWEDDWPGDVDPEGNYTFDVPLGEAASMSPDDAGTLPPDDQDQTNVLRVHRAAPEWIRRWPGPFRVSIENRDEIEAALNADDGLSRVYATMLRPVGAATLPEGLIWEYVTAPRDLAHHRPDLVALGAYPHGTFRATRRITCDDLDPFELRVVGVLHKARAAAI